MPINQRIIQAKCKTIWYNAIKNGQKTVEGRKNTEPWKSLKNGDIIFIESSDNPLLPPIKTCVLDIKRYDTLIEYLEGETLKKTLPGVSTITEGCKIYNEFWSDEVIQKIGGIIAIRITLI